MYKLYSVSPKSVILKDENGNRFEIPLDKLACRISICEEITLEELQEQAIKQNEATF